LGNANEYAKNIVNTIKNKTVYRIWYRPKPSFKEASPIEGTYYDRERGRHALNLLLENTHLIITDGSYISSQAVINGVPAIVLNGGIAYSVTGHTLDNIEDPYWPSKRKRLNWYADIGYSHYTIPEIASGLAWEVMKQKI
jgi:hypothetical protein